MAESTHTRPLRGRTKPHPAIASNRARPTRHGTPPRNRLVAQRSRIHGKGLFAADAFRKGELIGRFEGPPAKRDGKFLFLIECRRGENWPGLKEQLWGRWWKGIRVTNILKYANHSNSPNAVADGVYLYALRTIRPGEEITWHYGPDWEE